MIRIGHGYDVHKFCDGRKLILGGVEIPYRMGLLGHSDADCALHALMDALLGAAGLGDIGKLFPDSDEKYKNISSLILLREVYEKLYSLGYSLVNADITIIAQEPKLSGFTESMKKNISNVLKCTPDSINIKATTEERLGFTGRLEGISSHAVCIIEK